MNYHKYVGVGQNIMLYQGIFHIIAEMLSKILINSEMVIKILGLITVTGLIKVNSVIKI